MLQAETPTSWHWINSRTTNTNNSNSTALSSSSIITTTNPLSTSTAVNLSPSTRPILEAPSALSGFGALTLPSDRLRNAFPFLKPPTINSLQGMFGLTNIHRTNYGLNHELNSNTELCHCNSASGKLFAPFLSLNSLQNESSQRMDSTEVIAEQK